MSGWNIDTTVPVIEDALLGANPLFLNPDPGIDEVGCDLPGWSHDPDAAADYYGAAIACHHEAWQGAFAGLGIELQVPPLWAGAHTADYDGACGSNSTGREAFYCSADQTIVMPFDTMKSIAQYGAGYALAVLPHEYGHHLQEQAGVFAAFSARGDEVGWESEDGQLLNRMLELQAWCFSGMFYGMNVGSGDITQGLWDQAYDNNSHAGDRSGELRYHGTNESIANWFGWGAEPGDEASSNTPSPYECNPWAARSQDWLQ